MPAAGRVELDGIPIGGLGAGVRARRIAYLPQGASAYWPLLGRDLVALGRLPHGANLERPLAVQDAEAVERAGGGSTGWRSPIAPSTRCRRASARA